MQSRAFNHGLYIQDCIKSVINQDYENIELIIIDDGSSDDSIEKIEKLIPECQNRFKRFCFKSRENKGLAGTLNEAIKWSRGEFFSAIASDDLMYPTKTSVLVEKLQSDLGAAGIFCSFDVIDLIGKRVSRSELIDRVYDFEDIILRRHNIAAATQLLRTEKLLEVGLYCESIYIEDWYMWLLLTKDGGYLRVIDEVLVAYRQHELSMSKNIEAMLEGRKKILYLYKHNKNYAASLAVVYLMASIDFSVTNKTRSLRLWVDCLKTDIRMLKNYRCYEAFLRILLPPLLTTWLKARF